ncbi:MAG: carbohydrate ABC transporter permease, partial [Anaerolineales bacterium]
MRNSSRRLAGVVARQAASAALAFVFVVPLVWMVVGSLRATGLPPARGFQWPAWPPAWDNYRRIFEILPLGRYALNSLIVAALAVPLTVVS